METDWPNGQTRQSESIIVAPPIFCGGGIYNNKRAQRALGRSPEEKVKGHSRAIYREPKNVVHQILVEDL